MCGRTGHCHSARTRRRLADGQFISRADERTYTPGRAGGGDSGDSPPAFSPHCPSVDKFFTDSCAAALAQVFSHLRGFCSLMRHRSDVFGRRPSRPSLGPLRFVLAVITSAVPFRPSSAPDSSLALAHSQLPALGHYCRLSNYCETTCFWLSES